MEKFPGPKAKENEIIERKFIEIAAGYLSAEWMDFSGDPELMSKLKDPAFREKAGEYMRRMNELEQLQAENPQALGPADYEDLVRFEKMVKELEARRTVEKKEDRLLDRELIQTLAVYLSAEYVTTSTGKRGLQKDLDDPSLRAKAAQYMEKMNRIEEILQNKPELIGPADFEELEEFKGKVALVEAAMDRGKQKTG